MAKIVGGFLVPHDPIMFVAPNAPDKIVADKAWEAYETCAQNLAAMDVTTVIIVGNDHYMLFGTTCLPKYCIGTGHVEGPIDRLPGLNKALVNNNEALASFIASDGAEQGFDWAVARSFTTDHAFSIPYQLIVQRAEAISGREIKAIPVYLGSAVDPFISMKRCRELGEQIAASVSRFDSDENVAVIGSGGISHWVGVKESGKVNPEFDQRIIDLCCNQDLDQMIALSDEQILEQGGNGAMELRNFVCAMAAVGAGTVSLIEYQPVPEWVTGLGFMELRAS
ncbi:protocatechuate 4,5-dioxygenase, beta chain [Amphritea atlantica]|uniref:Protocatechuate 4,5-dioxygenase, beta chain n=1 Tax=Amphritea atlantica TaxID=355243 RepID=A0A1H9KES0_9GAMM|nr:protocatechuate 3,4-dioxygenase [Amphritea atlantica]SEQ97644.1 protocatechuate 4,5-dioxygenase, beta chain [Amphritea atlantica]